LEESNCKIIFKENRSFSICTCKTKELSNALDQIISSNPKESADGDEAKPTENLEYVFSQSSKPYLIRMIIFTIFFLLSSAAACFFFVQQFYRDDWLTLILFVICLFCFGNFLFFFKTSLSKRSRKFPVITETEIIFWSNKKLNTYNVQHLKGFRSIKENDDWNEVELSFADNTSYVVMTLNTFQFKKVLENLIKRNKEQENSVDPIKIVKQLFFEDRKARRKSTLIKACILAFLSTFFTTAIILSFIIPPQEKSKNQVDFQR